MEELNKSFSLETLTEQINKHIMAHGANNFTINLVESISKILNVAIGPKLANELNNFKENKITPMLLLATIIRLVNKVHEEDTDRIYLGTKAMARILEVEPSGAFIQHLNVIESKILAALDHNVSFSNLNVHNNHHKSKLW